jgi:AcrR family transcriptional regulator
MANYSTGRITYEKILSVCRKLFYEKGYRDTSFGEICKAAQVNPGSIAYHFKGKHAIATGIYTEMITGESVKIKELFHDEDELTVLMLGRYTHQWLLFNDPAYRKFSLQVLSESIDEIIQDKYEHFAPLAYNYHLKNMSPAKADFFFSAIAGADSRIEFYIDQHIDSLKFEEVMRYTSELYLYFLDKTLLAPEIDRSLKLFKKLEITNAGFDIFIRFKNCRAGTGRPSLQ